MARVMPIYMDYQATTPIDERVLDAMLPYMRQSFGNPHSAEHAYGWEAEAAVQVARGHVAHLIGAQESEIIFTSGATESNNLALKGVVEFYSKDTGKNHIITCQTEHKCILDSCRYLSSQGINITYLPVDSDGLIDLSELASAITPKTLMVSVMAVNNEIGVVQPIEAIGEICKKNQIFFHTDAAQAFGKIALDVATSHIDLLSISGHKIYGPKGIGALYLRKRPSVRIKPQIHGGGQEKGLRAGTLATHQVVGLGHAAKIASAQMKQDTQLLSKLSKIFIDGVVQLYPKAKLNGHPEYRVPGNLNICFEGKRADSLILALKKLAVSSGSACASASTEPSYVLKSLGLTKSQIESSIRFSLGRMTTQEDIQKALQAIKGALVS